MTAVTPSLHERPALLTGYPAAFVIILLMYALGLIASRWNSQTFDEGAHLAGGYIHLLLGQPRIHTENGYLSQAIAALPLLLTHPNLPDQTSLAFQYGQPFGLGREFLYRSNNDPFELLLLGRAAIGLLTAMTAFTVYAWSRKLFSPAAGILSLLIFSLSPIVLSHGFLVTSDMSATCFFTLSLAAFSWTLERVTILRVGLTALALAALFLAKMSAPLILPALFIVALIPRQQRTPAALGGEEVFARPYYRQLLKNLLVLVVLGVIVWFLIYAAYGFTYSAFKNSPRDSGQTLWPPGQWTWALDHPNVLLHAVAFARDYHLLPESYLYGYAYVVQTSRVIISFANGHETHTGWWWFYPFVFLVTTPLPVLGLILLATINAGARFRRSTVVQMKAVLLRTSALTVFICIYWICAILSYRGSGPRHLLPVYPMICILLGSAVVLLYQKGLLRYVVPALGLWLAVENVLIYPHYLSYVNEVAGGPRNAYRHLVDSAVDWGQDLPALEVFLAKNVPDQSDAYLSYFGTADPIAYGVRASILPSFLPRLTEKAMPDMPLLHAGFYCISVTMLQNLYNLEFAGPYTPAYEKVYQAMRRDIVHRDQSLQDPAISAQNRNILRHLPERFRNLCFVRLCAFLRKREPFARAGYSINIYAVTAADLDAALNGPPPFDAGGR